ncbi:MFS transporter [Spongiimicrobium sp. 2-473A-2-J]|uniref:MFS transporter n=1 Tax=Eudoraea algarum TaxID=3417568 RepID=UPI003D362038
MAQLHTSKNHGPAYTVLYMLSFAHFVNDALQSVIPAIYPLLKNNYALSFTQVGLIALSYQLTASLFQPLVGSITDRKPKPLALIGGALCTLVGIAALSRANTFVWILVAVSLIGLGSAIFHPESSRVANLASGGKRGLAQSIFQIGGNSGSAVGPLLVAALVIPYGQGNVLWFVVGSFFGIVALYKVGKWYSTYLTKKNLTPRQQLSTKPNQITKGRIRLSIAVLIVLIFSKYFYMASMTNYFTFYLIEKFQVSIQQSQLYLFTFLGAVAIGTYFGGPLGDRYGRKKIIWGSILGAAPFTLLLPYVGLFWVLVLSICIGIIIASAFSAILVFAQELLPNRVGMVSGLFFGLAFGLGGVGSALLGNLADQTGIEYVFQLCAFLPLLGVVAVLLPNLRESED